MQDPEPADDSHELAPELRAALGGRYLRPLAIAFAVLNALAAATAVFGAVIYVGEAGDRQLQRDTFQALAIEMLFARLDRARRTYVDSSGILARLNAFDVGVSDLDLSRLRFFDVPDAPHTTVFLRGEEYVVDCPAGDGSRLNIDGPGSVMGCEADTLTVDLRNPVDVGFRRGTLIEPTFYCRTGSHLRLADVTLTRPTFECRPEQVEFVGPPGANTAAPADARWCHPDDDPAETGRRGPPVYASGPCQGEAFPFFLDQHVDEGLPGTP